MTHLLILVLLVVRNQLVSCLLVSVCLVSTCLVFLFALPLDTVLATCTRYSVVADACSVCLGTFLTTTSCDGSDKVGFDGADKEDID